MNNLGKHHMKWTDTHAIAKKLAQRYPTIDPKAIRFTQLRSLVLTLEGFNDEPEHCGEKILEAIQAHWITGNDDEEDED